MKKLSLYIHIPFCEVKCGYCDFYSVPRGHGEFNLQREYVEQLVREIDQRSSETSPDGGRSQVLSLFFGGGTPSLLEPHLLEKILKTLQRHFSWDDRTEITLESNPKTVSREKLSAFRALGINRLSVGVQSFQDRFLKVMGRIHSGDEARKTIDDARKAGFDNMSLDLIYALPGQVFEDWRQDLEEALSLETPHISAYHLTIEEGTSFETLYKKGRLRLPEEEVGLQCLTWTRDRLCQARREAYEISNFSLPGFESVHNRNYWHYGEYLGVGAGAASFMRKENGPTYGRRRNNVRDLKRYLEGHWEGSHEDISLPTAMGEFCMLGLRTREGIRDQDFADAFGKSLSEVFTEPILDSMKKGWLESYQKGWRLTSEGILFSNEVAASFLP